ncbi:MAG: LicD family protein [Erysipelotrichia bacterium]|nr:LicD family protein [Erysipelotrichia bacterium]
MKELTLDEIKEVLIELLEEFDEICRKEGLNYSLGGGSAIGAVRHKGFIPWDDDIDVAMLRKDYNKFIEYCKTHKTTFKTCFHETNSNYYLMFGKVYNPNTKFIQDKVISADQVGIALDIFPIDYLAKDYDTSLKLYKKSEFLRNLLLTKNWKKYYKGKSDNKILEIGRWMFFALSRFLNGKKLIEKIEKIYINNKKENAEFAMCVCGVYEEKEIMSKKIYDEYMDIEFEGKNYMIFTKYDEYLRQMFGDYMKLPPKEKQKPHHEYPAYWVKSK